MVGILVHGNNHFILRGPPPDEGSGCGDRAALVRGANRRRAVIDFRVVKDSRERVSRKPGVGGGGCR
jgi:hypothetical protein